MPTTANNETLERIKKDAERIYPSTRARMQMLRVAYENGAISERNKAIDEAIDKVYSAMLEGVLKYGVRVKPDAKDIRNILEALKSDKK